jgi:hypothetical protein
VSAAQKVGVGHFVILSIVGTGQVPELDSPDTAAGGGPCHFKALTKPLDMAVGDQANGKSEERFADVVAVLRVRRRRRIDHRPGPVQLVLRPRLLRQHRMELVPDASLVPDGRAPPAGHATVHAT